GLVALLAELEVVRAEGEVAELGAAGRTRGIEALPPHHLQQLGARRAAGRGPELAVQPDLDAGGLRDHEGAGQGPRELHLQRLRGLGRDADRTRLRAISLARDLHRVLPGQDAQREEIGGAEELAVRADLT